MPAPRPPRSPRTTGSFRAPRAPRLPRLRLSPVRSNGSIELDTATTRSGYTLPPYIRWDRFMTDWKWRQGEHLTTIGPTGSGKTVLNRYLLRRRSYVVVLGVKQRDPELYGPFQADGYQLVRKFDPHVPDDEDEKRVLFVPMVEKFGAAGRNEQTVKFREALQDIMSVGNWCVYADEVRYMSDQLGLRTEFEEIWIKGRSERITMIASSQEPVDIPVMAYGQASHLFLFRNADLYRAKRMAELTGVNREMAQETILRLPPHEFLYVHKDSGKMLRSKVIREDS